MSTTTEAAPIVITPWMPMLTDDGADAYPTVPTNPERHRLLRHLALELMDMHYPWLRKVLVAAQGQVLVDNGRFYVALPSNLGDWIEIEALSRFMHLMPWAEDGEAEH